MKVSDPTKGRNLKLLLKGQPPPGITNDWVAESRGFHSGLYTAVLSMSHHFVLNLVSMCYGPGADTTSMRLWLRSALVCVVLHTGTLCSVQVVGRVCLSTKLSIMPPKGGLLIVLQSFVGIGEQHNLKMI